MATARVLVSLKLLIGPGRCQVRDTSGYRGVFLAVIIIIIIECVLYQEPRYLGITSICRFFLFIKEPDTTFVYSKLIKLSRRN